MTHLIRLENKVGATCRRIEFGHCKGADGIDFSDPQEVSFRLMSVQNNSHDSAKIKKFLSHLIPSEGNQGGLQHGNNI